MKNSPVFLLFLLSCFCSINLQAQKPHNLQTHYLQQLIRYYDLTEQDLEDAVLNSSHTSSISGIQHYYYRQSYQGIEINPANASMHILPDGKVLSHSSSFIKNPGQFITSPNTPVISAKNAIQMAAAHLGYTITQPLQLLNEDIGAIDRKALFSKGGISLENIPVRLMYQLLEDGSIRLAWDLSIDEISGNNWWSIRIDATNGALLHKNNWTTTCSFEHNHGDQCDSNNPISTTDGIETGTITTNYKVHEAPIWMPPVMVGNYNVYAMPVESPNHGGRTLVADPDNAPASPFGWHDTNGAAGAEYTITRGNNVHAYEDGDNPNYAPNGGTSLVFNYPINTTYSQADQSEDAAITNLFYWSNICHDLWYQYGFDEASGNFQQNNYGNGGAGGDYCRSEAQDNSGTCNANMSTPTDGNRPRMQMYVCNSRDGDLDNGVIVHEYGHGISTRLTGGPNNSSCLGNQEQMGEGWSDWFALIMTIESGDAGSNSRGIGTWLFGQSASGPGIRPHPYSTSMAINPHTYDDIKTEAVPHGVGSVWCAMIWEVAWALIDEYGFDADFYSGTGGNNMAMALITEALKIQPCSPGFVDGRDAILDADVALYGGDNECLIWEAFAKRGLGFSAAQGNSGSVTDGTEAFDVPPACLYPALSFTTSTINTIEGDQPEFPAEAGDCRPYTDHEIRVVLSSTPSVPANVSIVVASGTLDVNDYELIDANMIFPVGGEQIATLRIYNDATIEASENIQLELVLNNAGATDAQLAGTTTMAVTVGTNDFAPGAPSPYEVDNAGYETGTDGYSSTNPGGGDVFERGTNADASSSFWSVPAPLDGSSYLFYANDDACNCTMNNVSLISPVFDLSNISSAELTYDVFFEGRTYQGTTETAQILVSTNGGASFSVLSNISGVTGLWREETEDLSAYDGMNNIAIGIRYNDGGGWLYGIAVDHIRIGGLLDFTPDIATALNEIDEQDVPPSAIAYFYDSNGNLMAGIENGANDLGCVQVQIDRAGTGTTPFWDNLPEHNLANKTFLITPENNAANAAYTVTLYFTAAETTAWENETGNVWGANVNIVKHPTAISDVTPQNPYPNGQGTIEQAVDLAGTTGFSNGYFVKASFTTGFSGMGVGNPGTDPLPVELMLFQGQYIGSGNQLEWRTASETNNHYFDVQRSTDGLNFESIGRVDGKGTTDLVNNYSYLDKTIASGIYYYRLRQVDFDGTFEFSNTIVIKIANTSGQVQVYPNPAKAGIYLSLSENSMEATGLVLYNDVGQLVLQQIVNIKNGTAYYLDLTDLPAGVYYGELDDENNEVIRFRFLRE
jgi:Fungalysin metallopeptidase (M36)/Fungalysin/Thermolysin Propeptide Motif/Secretion system C-terminal sorting domain